MAIILSCWGALAGLHGQILINGSRVMPNTSTPPAPAAGYVSFYMKSGSLCLENSGATETCLGTGSGGVLTVVSFSATPTFTCAGGAAPQTFVMTLTGAVTSSTLASCTQGQIVTWQIYQDGTGNRGFVWPGNVTNPPPVVPDASVYSTGSCMVDNAGNCIFLAAVTSATYSLLPTVAAPGGSPAAGNMKLWADSTAATLQTRNSSGSVASMIYTGNCSTSTWLIGYGGTGNRACTQPSVADVLGIAPAPGGTIITSGNLGAGNDGIPVRANCASACTLTIPSGLGAGWNTIVWQVGAGQVTIAAGGGVTLIQAHGFTKTVAAGSPATIWCDATDHCLLAGDLQ